MTSQNRSIWSSARFRLFVLVVAVAFSFGGFSFYAGVVVPIGGDVFDVTAQGFVTRKVTHVINVASGLTLVTFVWDGIAVRGQRRRRENSLVAGLIVLLGACLTILVVLHPRLDILLNDQDFSVSEPERFYRLHQVYLWISTIQWSATLVMIWLICKVRVESVPAEHGCSY